MRSSNPPITHQTHQQIEEDVNGDLIGEMPTSFRITSIGAYHLKRWMGGFTYIDAMAFDTPVFGQDARTIMLSHLDSFAIKNRYERAFEFRKYLKKCWNDLTDKPPYLDINQIFLEGEHTFETLRRAIDRL